MNIQPSWWEQFSDEQIRSTYDFSTEDGFPGYFGSGYVSRLIAAHPEHPIVIDDQLFDIILDHLIRNPDYRDDEMRLLIGQMRVKDLLEFAPEESESAPLFVHGLMCGRMAIVKSFMEVFPWLVTQLYPDAIAIACLGDPKFPTDNLILLEYLLSRSELDPNQKLVFFAPTVEFYELKPIEIASIVSNPRYVIALLSDSRLNITDVDAYVIFNGIGTSDDLACYYDKMVSLTLDKLLMSQEHLWNWKQKMRVIVSKLITSHDRKQDEQWRIRLLITELLLRGFDPTDENNALIYTAIGRRDKLFLKLLINAPTVFLPEALEIFEFLTERMNGSSVSLEDLMNTLDKWREDVKIALRKYHATNSKTQLSGHFERWFQNPPLKKSTKTKLEYYRGSLSRLSTPASVRIFGSAITEQVQRLANQVQQGLDYLFEKWAYRYLITIRDIQERNLVSL